MKVLDNNGLTKLWDLIKALVNKKVDKVYGKSLIDDTEISRLASVKTGLEVSNTDSTTKEKAEYVFKQDNKGYYPITTYDQIILPDENRWNGEAEDLGAIIVDRTDSTIGTPALINADTLGGVPASNYALKGDITGSGGLPAGGTNGQVLAKASSTNYDVRWVNIAGLDGNIDADTLDGKTYLQLKEAILAEVVYQ